MIMKNVVLVICAPLLVATLCIGTARAQETVQAGYRIYRGDGYRFLVPETWKEYTFPNGVKVIAPEEGTVAGKGFFTYGILVQVSSGELSDVAQRYLSDMRKDPKHVRTANLDQSSTSGRNSLHTTVVLNVPTKGYREMLRTHFISLDNQRALILAFIAPESEISRYQSIYRAVLDNVKINRPVGVAAQKPPPVSSQSEQPPSPSEKNKAIATTEESNKQVESEKKHEISSTGEQLPIIRQAVERDMSDLEKQVAAGTMSWRALMPLKIAEANSRPSALKYGVASFVCLKAGNETGAAEYLEKAVALADDAEWRELLIVYYWGLRRFDEVERHLAAAIRLQPGDRKYFALRCRMFLITKGAAEGVTCFEEVTKKWSLVADDYLALGVGYWKLNRLGEAEATLHKTIKLAPDMAKAHFVLAGIYMKQEKIAAALEAYRTGAKLDPKQKAEVDAMFAKEGVSIEQRLDAER